MAIARRNTALEEHGNVVVASHVCLASCLRTEEIREGNGKLGSCLCQEPTQLEMMEFCCIHLSGRPHVSRISILTIGILCANIGNVQPRDVLSAAALRVGLRGDTISALRKEDWKKYHSSQNAPDIYTI